MVPVTTGRPTVVLDEVNIPAYLQRRGLLGPEEDAAVDRLQGGYVNNVFRADCGQRARGPGESPAKIFILKQSLEAAQRTVLAADIGRGLVEVAAMKTIAGLLGPLAPIPTILDDDAANFVSIMTPAPDDARLYETELLAGRFHPGTGRALGTYAGHLHARTEGQADLAAAFADNPGFALRDQSIRSAAATNPELAPLIEDALRRNRDEARVLVDADITPKNVLVHGAEAAGDGAAGITPKNLLVHGAEAAGGNAMGRQVKPPSITKLDFECAQWGHPALDVGIMVAHFILLGFARPQWREPLLAEARDCSTAYAALRPEAGSPAFSADVALFAAVMMLGRADGALVFDYLIPHRPRLRTLAADLCANVRTPADLITRAGATLADLAV